MSESYPDLAAMSREELLLELARLETERDALQSNIGAKDSSPEPDSREDALRRQVERIRQIGDMLASRQQ